MKRKLSRRAAKLLHRLYEGHFYPCTFEGAIPKAMQELIDARLIESGGRVARIMRCYVPKGMKTFRLERLPEKPKWLLKL